MLNLDSIKIKMQLEDLDFNVSKYKTRIEFDESSSRTMYVLNQDVNKHLGLGRVEILPTNNEVLVQCSAKILQEQYLDGINGNTLERLRDNINPYIRCSVDDVANSILLRADVTQNLYFDTREQKENAIQALKLGKSNVAFKVDDYSDRRESIIFTGRQTSYKNRQLYYNKEKELGLTRNKEILSILYKNKVDNIHKILRVEQNITSFEKLRYAIGKKAVNTKLIGAAGIDNVNAVKLREMVCSNQKPLLKRHQLIMQYANQVDLFTEYEDYDTMLKIEG